MSKLSSHTTGEWTVLPGTIQPRICVDGDPEWPIVIVSAGPSDREIFANELLMAAAPNLLSAIEDALNNDHKMSARSRKKMMAAYKKAKGL